MTRAAGRPTRNSRPAATSQIATPIVDLRRAGRRRVATRRARSGTSRSASPASTRVDAPSGETRCMPSGRECAIHWPVGDQSVGAAARSRLIQPNDRPAAERRLDEIPAAVLQPAVGDPVAIGRPARAVLVGGLRVEPHAASRPPSDRSRSDARPHRCRRRRVDRRATGALRPAGSRDPARSVAPPIAAATCRCRTGGDSGVAIGVGDVRQHARRRTCPGCDSDRDVASSGSGGPPSIGNWIRSSPRLAARRTRCGSRPARRSDCPRRPFLLSAALSVPVVVSAINSRFVAAVQWIAAHDDAAAVGHPADRRNSMRDTARRRARDVPTPPGQGISQMPRDWLSAVVLASMASVVPSGENASAWTFTSGCGMPAGSSGRASPVRVSSVHSRRLRPLDRELKTIVRPSGLMQALTRRTRVWRTPLAWRDGRRTRAAARRRRRPPTRDCRRSRARSRSAIRPATRTALHGRGLLASPASTAPHRCRAGRSAAGR